MSKNIKINTPPAKNVADATKDATSGDATTNLNDVAAVADGTTEEKKPEVDEAASPILETPVDVEEQEISNSVFDFEVDKNIKVEAPEKQLPAHDDEVNLHTMNGDAAKAIKKGLPTQSQHVTESELPEAIKNVVAEFFENNPEHDDVFVTSDGNCFYTKDKNYAVDHKIKNDVTLHFCERID